MSRYKRADEFPLTDEQKELIRYHEEVQGGHMTNMKYTLLRKPVAFQVYMGWYDLKKDALKFLTQHEITIFCHAISSENHCLVCGTFFRRILIDWGEDPDNPRLTEREQLLWDFGQAFVDDFHNIPREIYNRLDQEFSEEEVIELIALAGQMDATNRFVTVAKVELDQVLYDYLADGQKEE